MRPHLPSLHRDGGTCYFLSIQGHVKGNVEVRIMRRDSRSLEDGAGRKKGDMTCARGFLQRTQYFSRDTLALCFLGVHLPLTTGFIFYFLLNLGLSVICSQLMTQSVIKPSYQSK